MARQDLDRDFYEAALRGYEQTKNELEDKIAELRSLLHGGRPAPRPAAEGQSRLSAEGRRRIAEAQKRRWARVRAQARGGSRKRSKPAAAASGSSRESKSA